MFCKCKSKNDKLTVNTNSIQDVNKAFFFIINQFLPYDKLNLMCFICTHYTYIFVLIIT